MRVALVHDDLVQWGGAERMLLGLSEAFPDAPIFTSLFDQNNLILKDKFKGKKIHTSFLQKIPGWKFLYRILLPFYPMAFEQFNFDKFDLVISQTTRFAKCIITKPEVKHLCICHTPPRFLYHFSDKKTYGLAEIIMTKLRVIDRISAQRVDKFLAGSDNAKKRIKKIYNRNSDVLYPFVDLDRFKNMESFDGGYFVVVSRLNKYKRVDLAIKACNKLNYRLKIVGVGPELDKLKSLNKKNLVEFLGSVNDEYLSLVLLGAKALIVPSEEDFGLVSLEAQALQKPVVALKKGGSLETLQDSKNAILFDEQTEEDLSKALNKISTLKLDSIYNKKSLEKFSKETFMRKLKHSVVKLMYT